MHAKAEAISFSSWGPCDGIFWACLWYRVCSCQLKRWLDALLPSEASSTIGLAGSQVSKGSVAAQNSHGVDGSNPAAPDLIVMDTFVSRGPQVWWELFQPSIPELLVKNFRFVAIVWLYICSGFEQLIGMYFALACKERQWE